MALDALLAIALLGAALLSVAEFTPLFALYAAGSNTPVGTVMTGSHQAYALLPLSVLAAALVLLYWREQSRPAALAIGVLGTIALLIALIGDLPDAQATGVIHSGSSGYVAASSRPGAGIYLETLGAVLLLIASVGVWLALGRGWEGSGGGVGAAESLGDGTAAGDTAGGAGTAERPGGAPAGDTAGGAATAERPGGAPVRPARRSAS